MSPWVRVVSEIARPRSATFQQIAYLAGSCGIACDPDGPAGAASASKFGDAAVNRKNSRFSRCRLLKHISSLGRSIYQEPVRFSGFFTVAPGASSCFYGHSRPPQRIATIRCVTDWHGNYCDLHAASRNVLTMPARHLPREWGIRRRDAALSL